MWIIIIISKKPSISKMNSSEKNIILFDLSHNEMLNPNEAEYSDFIELLKRLHLDIQTNTAELTKDSLQKIKILIIGNPINDIFSQKEINVIIDFVRLGGSLIIISEFGGDFLQKTNINDFSSKFFGIYFEKNIIKEKRKDSDSVSSIIKINNFSPHPIMSQLRELIIGGTCSLILNEKAHRLLEINNSVWSEIYNSLTKEWDQDKKNKEIIISSYCEYGKGKVLALGDIDIFSNDNNIGINQLDNRKFISNVLNWLLEPQQDKDIIKWTLNNIGILAKEIKNLHTKINNIIETITFLESRMTNIEDSISRLKR